MAFSENLNFTRRKGKNKKYRLVKKQVYKKPNCKKQEDTLGNCFNPYFCCGHFAGQDSIESVSALFHSLERSIMYPFPIWKENMYCNVQFKVVTSGL